MGCVVTVLLIDVCVTDTLLGPLDPPDGLLDACPGQHPLQQQYMLHDPQLQLQQPQQQLFLQSAISPVKMLHDIGRQKRHMQRSQSKKWQMHSVQEQQLHVGMLFNLDSAKWELQRCFRDES